MNRPQITQQEIDYIIDNFKTRLQARLDKHGRGSFITSHEMLGQMTEEYLELVEAVKLEGGRKPSGFSIYNELYDIAVVALFGAAGHVSGKMEVD